MAELIYKGNSSDIENVLKYYCPLCSHCKGKKVCPLRKALLKNITQRTYQEEKLIASAIKDNACKWFESRDNNVKPPKPKDRDRHKR